MAQRHALTVCRRKQKQAAAQDAGNPHSQDAAKKGKRAAVFADWLIATFGRSGHSHNFIAQLSLCLGLQHTSHMHAIFASYVFGSREMQLLLLGGAHVTRQC